MSEPETTIKPAEETAIEPDTSPIVEGVAFREKTIRASSSYVEAAEALKAKGLYADKNARDLGEVLRRWANRNGVTTAYVVPASSSQRMAQRLQLAEAALGKLDDIASGMGKQPDPTTVARASGRMCQVLADYEAARKPLG